MDKNYWIRLNNLFLIHDCYQIFQNNLFLYYPYRGSVVCIDEPEAGLHPDMINGIAKGIKYAAQNGTQMIIATHSPLLLNAFELEDLMIFEKDKDNQSIVKSVSEDDFPDWEGEFLTGQMWLRGELGGVRW